jgi:hypothetical protein
MISLHPLRLENIKDSQNLVAKNIVCLFFYCKWIEYDFLTITSAVLLTWSEAGLHSKSPATLLVVNSRKNTIFDCNSLG